MNPYKLLGVHKKSTDEEIAAAYKARAQQHHPDRGGSAAKFNQLNEAYNLIKDKKRRRKFEESMYMEDRCYACQTRGVTWKQKGLGEKVYSPCTVCGGSGFCNLETEEITEEETTDVIEL